MLSSNVSYHDIIDIIYHLLQGSVPNKFYVHNDIFRYEDEVFGDSEGELDEGEKNCTCGVEFGLVPLMLPISQSVWRTWKDANCSIVM